MYKDGISGNPAEVDMQRFGLSREDAQDRDYWRLRIKTEPANPGLPGFLNYVLPAHHNFYVI